MTTQWQHIIKTHQADYTRILAEEIGSVTSILDQTLSLMSLAALTIIYTALCFYLSPGLTVIAIILGFVLLLTTHPIQSLISHLGEKHLVATEKIFKLASDQIKGLKVIKSSGTEHRHNLHYAETVESLATEELSYYRLTSLTQILHSTISALAFCVLAYIAYEMMNQDIVTLMILALIFSRLMPQISRLRTYLQRTAYLEPSLNSVSALLHHLRSHQETGGVETTFDLSSGLHLENVCYQYPDGDEMVLDNINGSLSTNQLVALTGDSGIGKSTLADIIAGISLPTSGKIRIGDTILDENNQRSWRQYVTYLPQVPFLIESTVRENLNLLLPADADDDQLNRAIDLAAANFLHRLPQGLETVIGDNGVTLSGGERQRLQLARGLLEDRPVMILDETTGNLDLGTEDSIVATLATLKARRLIIMISHRPSISEFADQVFTLI